MRTVVALVITAWALWWAHRGRKKDERELQDSRRKACPKCKGTTTIRCIDNEDDGTPRSRYMYCFTCDHKYDFIPWEEGGD